MLLKLYCTCYFDGKEHLLRATAYTTVEVDGQSRKVSYTDSTLCSAKEGLIQRLDELEIDYKIESTVLSTEEEKDVSSE